MLLPECETHLMMLIVVRLTIPPIKPGCYDVTVLLKEASDDKDKGKMMQKIICSKDKG